jgi:hypothetical protein
MKGISNEVILINTTVLSNFALAQAIPRLADFCGGKALATEQVLGEFGNGVHQGIVPATFLSWLCVTIPWTRRK